MERKFIQFIIWGQESSTLVEDYEVGYFDKNQIIDGSKFLIE